MKKYAAFAASVAISGAMLVGCGGDDDFCDSVSQDDFDMFTNLDPNDPDAMSEAADRLDELAADAPDDVKGDFEAAAEGFRQIADAEGDPAALQEIDSEALTTAGENITSWGNENCE